MKTPALTILTLLTLLPGLATAQTAQSILQKMQELQRDRWEGVNTYVITQNVMGQSVALGFERTQVKGADGKSYPAFKPIEKGSMDPSSQAFLAAYGDGARQVGDGLGREMDKGMAAAGLPPGLLGAGGSDPWASMDPRVMMGGAADFAEAAAGAGTESKPAAGPDFTYADLSAKARLAGRDTVDGRPVFHLVADNLGMVQEADGQTFRMDQLDLWVDTEQYVPLRTRISGVASAEGQTQPQPVTIERLDSDYRQVAGSKMYESHQHVMRIAGATTPEQAAEIEQAKAQMAEMEKQLAGMPPAQRAMIERQMAPQMQMMRSMGADGGFEMRTTVERIVVNPDAATLQALRAPPSVMGIAPAAGGAASLAAPVATAAPAAAEPDAARKACLEQKMAEAKQKEKTKRGLGRLMGAAGRVANRLGVPEVNRAISDIGTADATADDLAAAARDLGITEEEIAACGSP